MGLPCSFSFFIYQQKGVCTLSSITVNALGRRESAIVIHFIWRKPNETRANQSWVRSESSSLNAGTFHNGDGSEIRPPAFQSPLGKRKKSGPFFKNYQKIARIFLFSTIFAGFDRKNLQKPGIFVNLRGFPY